jgi:hypothetical protein
MGMASFGMGIGIFCDFLFIVLTLSVFVGVRFIRIEPYPGRRSAAWEGLGGRIKQLRRELKADVAAVRADVAGVQDKILQIHAMLEQLVSQS